MSTSVMQVRVDDEIRDEATRIFNDLGLDMSTAIRIFLKRAIKEEGIPFPMNSSQRDTGGSAVIAMRRISEKAKLDGLSDMSLEEINDEIAAVRRERAKR